MLALKTPATKEAAQQHVRMWLVRRLMRALVAAPAPATLLTTPTRRPTAALVSLVQLAAPHRVRVLNHAVFACMDVTQRQSLGQLMMATMPAARTPLLLAACRVNLVASKR